MNKQADLILPIPKWINREGTIITSEKRELQVNKVFDGPQIVDIIKSYL
jgi:NADH dehydrogenase/NADH:ubiquinone oxidoreductase subunit G